MQVHRTCSLDGCDRPHAARGMCSTHYGYWLHHGIPEPPEPRSFEERFWERVDRSGGPGACHPWTRAKTPRGYGAVTWHNRSQRAHRMAWIITYGPIPAGLNVLHRCDNPPCCNSAHLFLGTAADNNADMRAKGRWKRKPRTHCINGHEYVPGNTYWDSDGRRRCVSCRRQQWRERQRVLRAARR